MGITSITTRGNTVVVAVAGRIDTGNASDFERAVRTGLSGRPKCPVVLDLQGLSYVSSAGLRAFMRIAKEAGHLSMENAQPDVYDVLQMTGFCEMFSVTRALRSLSVEGCKIIGHGAKGAVYRLDPETIVKVVYATGDEALHNIMRERELARAAFVAGVPTAISYDVVRVGKGYGAVYELLDAKTLAELVALGEVGPAQAASMLGSLMAHMHGAHARKDLMPSARDLQLEELAVLGGRIESKLFGRIASCVGALPDKGNLIHGDLHAGNVMVQDGEALLIDMDTLSYGNAALELGPVYNAYVGFGELDHNVSERFLGFPYEVGTSIWEGIVSHYARLRGLDPGHVALVGEVMGRIRQLRRIVAHGQQDTEHGRAVLECCGSRVAMLLDEVDSLEL